MTSVAIARAPPLLELLAGDATRPRVLEISSLCSRRSESIASSDDIACPPPGGGESLGSSTPVASAMYRALNSRSFGGSDALNCSRSARGCSEDCAARSDSFVAAADEGEVLDAARQPRLVVSLRPSVKASC